MKRKDIKVILFYVVLIVVIVFFFSRMIGNRMNAEPLKYSDVVVMFTDGEVKEFYLSQTDLLTMTLNDGTKLSYQLADRSIFYNDLDDLIQEQVKAGTLIAEYEPPTVVPWWVSLLPYAILIILFIGVWIYMANAANGKGAAMGSISPTETE